MSGVTFEQVRLIARNLPGVEDSTSYGTPALKVRGKLLAVCIKAGTVWCCVPIYWAARFCCSRIRVSSSSRTTIGTTHGFLCASRALMLARCRNSLNAHGVWSRPNRCCRSTIPIVSEPRTQSARNAAATGNRAARIAGNRPPTRPTTQAQATPTAIKLKPMCK